MRAVFLFVVLVFGFSCTVHAQGRISEQDEPEAAATNLTPKLVLPEGEHLVPQIGHDFRGMSTLAMSSDLTIAATGGGDGKVKIWDMVDDRLLRTIDAFNVGVGGLAVTNGGRSILASPEPIGYSPPHAREAVPIKLFDVASGRLLRTFPQDFISTIAVSPDGRRFVSGGGAFNELKLWNVETGALLATFADKDIGWGEYSRDAAFSDDQTHVASADTDGKVSRWNINTGEIEARFTSREFVDHAQFSPDLRTVLLNGIGTTQVIALDDKTVKRSLIRNAATREEIFLWPERATLLKLDHSEADVLSDLDSGEVIHRFHADERITGIDQFSADGRAAASLGAGGRIRIWDVATGSTMRAARGASEHIGRFQFTPDGLSFVGACGDRACVWNLETGALVRAFSQPQYRVAPLLQSSNGISMVLDQRPTLEPASHWGFSAVGPQTAGVWEIATASKATDFGAGIAVAAPPCEMGAGGDYLLLGSEIVPNENKADSLRFYSRIELWNRRGEKVRSYDAGGQQRDNARVYSAIDCTVDGGYFVAATPGELLDFWKADADEPEKSLQDRDAAAAFDAVARQYHRWPDKLDARQPVFIGLSPDGRFATLLNSSGVLRTWDTSSGKLVRTSEEPKGSVVSATFTKDRSRLLVAYQDRSLKFWDVKTGTLLKALAPGPAVVRTIAISPDGRRALSTNHDDTATLWDLETSMWLANYFFIDDQGVALTPTGRFISGGDPHRAFALVNGMSLQPLDEFIAKRRAATLSEAIALDRGD